MSDNNYDYCIGTANAGLRRTITTMLNEGGFISSGEGRSSPDFLRTLRSVQPWLAVIDTALPPGNIRELAEIIEDDVLAAALYINTTGTFLEKHVLIDWPVQRPVLVAVAGAVCSEYSRKKKLHHTINKLQRKIDERKVIEKAKNILADYYELGEPEAFRILQKYSMENRITLFETANRLITDPGCFSYFLPLR